MVFGCHVGGKLQSQGTLTENSLPASPSLYSEGPLPEVSLVILTAAGWLKGEMVPRQILEYLGLFEIKTNTSTQKLFRTLRITI